MTLKKKFTYILVMLDIQKNDVQVFSMIHLVNLDSEGLSGMMFDVHSLEAKIKVDHQYMNTIKFV